MGLLIQTSVLIMVIALITYSRLDLFIPRKAMEQQIVSFMSNTERSWMNANSQAYYDALHPTTKAANAGPRESSFGTGYISLRPLFGENEEMAGNTKAVLKSLLVELYAKQPFVTNEIKKGSFPDAASLFSELIDAIAQAGRNRALYSVDDKNLTTEDQFFRLNVGSLQSIFVNIVNGCSCQVDDAEQVVKNGSDEDEEGENESKAGVIPHNYCSLFTFANMLPYKQLSIYLAPEEVLMALYGNQQIVGEIMRTRTIANREYKKTKSPESKAALERFKSIPAVIDSKFLDYNVTTTNPNRKRKKK